MAQCHGCGAQVDTEHGNPHYSADYDVYCSSSCEKQHIAKICRDFGFASGSDSDDSPSKFVDTEGPRSTYIDSEGPPSTNRGYDP